MKGLHDSAIGDFTRGGQTTLMFFRMIGEVLKKFGRAIILLYSIGTVLLFMHRTTDYQRYLAVRYAISAVEVRYLKGSDQPTRFRYPGGSEGTTSYGRLYWAPAVRRNLDDLLAAWLRSMALTLTAAATILSLMFLAMWGFGRAQRVERRLRGGVIMKTQPLRQMLQSSGKGGTLALAGIPMLKDSETGHILITGSPGTGKSTVIYDLMRQIRQRGDRCICYSPSGDFIEGFYRNQQDVILNPFDARCPSWNLWRECPEPFHHDMLAAAIIPTAERDPFWNTASRVLFASLTQRMADHGDHSVGRFLERLTRGPLADLYAYLKETEAGAIIHPDSDKPALSIRTTAATYARALRYLPASADEFHIRDWVCNEQDDGWIFLNARPDQIDSVRPLLSAWLEIFTNSLLSLPPDQNRRIWLIIDELPSLNKIPSLPSFLAQSRKYGGCGAIAFQLLPQLREVYGKEAAASVTGLCSTWVCLRQNDPETAKWTATSFGESEYLEQQEGLQYGSHEMRDGVSLSQQRKMRPLLLPSEISSLKNLEGYVRMPADVPVGHFEMSRPHIPKRAEAFIPAKRLLALPAPERQQPVVAEASSVDVDALFLNALSGDGDAVDQHR